MSAAFKKLGFDVIAVDKFVPKSPKVMVTKLDVTQACNQQLIFDWISLPQVKGVFLAPPCGTASLARNIQDPDDPTLPLPLRSWDEPDGLQNLSDIDFLRVGQANILYEFTAACQDLCQKLGKFCACENPRDSLFWRTTPWCDRIFISNDVEQTHQACAYGSTRPKWTKLVANFQEITTVNKTCPGNHFHEPWGQQRKGNRRVFATSLEVHYPSGLCDAIAAAFATAFLRKGWKPQLMTPVNLAARAFSDNQPATNKLTTFLPDYKTKFVRVLLHQTQIWPERALDTSNTKLLHNLEMGGDNMQQLVLALQTQCVQWGCDVDISQLPVLSFPCCVHLQLFGCIWSEREFVERALEARHPLAVGEAMPEQLVAAIQFNLQKSDHEVAKLRTDFLAKWAMRAKQLQPAETNLKMSMDPYVANAVKSKRILLFKEMLEDTGFPDPGVADELQFGSDLVGEVPATGMLPGKVVPALSTLEELEQNAKRIRGKVENDSRGSGDPEVDRQVWIKTMDEVEAGWLVGPLKNHEVPQEHSISRRFGLVQKRGKLRLIDDYTESGVNSCVTSVEMPVLHTVDVAGAVLVQWFSACMDAGFSPQLVVRTFDLKSAYRQVGLSPRGRDYACLRVFDPSIGRVRFFRSVVLPFGAIRSVHAFLRLSRALWWIGVVGCKLLWTSFYDDFISCSRPSLATNTEATVSVLFHLLGWAFDETGDKCFPFSDSCEALGVAFDLSSSAKGIAYICNTASRVDELRAEISSVLEAGSLSSKQAQRLRGRMQFADSQLYGRSGKRCLRTLSDFAECKRFRLLPKDRLFLELFAELLRQNVPREIKAVEARNAVILTDACYERDSTDWPCGIGGVFFFQQKIFFFSVCLDETARKALGALVKKQIIFEAETIAAIVAFRLWLPHFVNERCILFVDNEGTKFSLLRGLSDNTTVDFLAEQFVQLEASYHAYTWLARVPSSCNIADPPSRGDTSGLLLQGATNVSADAEIILKDLVRQLLEVGRSGCVPIP